VVAKPKRRTFTAEYKRGILKETEAAAATRGGIGALLSREGLYSSLPATWWRERANGILEALTPQKRGPKSKRHPMDEENQKLRRQNARLAKDLRKAHIIIDVQKKWLHCWVNRFRSSTIRILDLNDSNWAFRRLNLPRPPCLMVRGGAKLGVNRIVSAPVEASPGSSRQLTSRVYPLRLQLAPDEEKGWKSYPIFRVWTAGL
jgi:transposase